MIIDDNYDGIICKVCKKEIVEDFVCVQYCQRLKAFKEIQMNIDYCCQNCWNHGNIIKNKERKKND